MKLTAPLLLCTLLATTPVLSGQGDRFDLMHSCISAEPVRQGFCSGYIAGIAAAIPRNPNAMAQHPDFDGICLPDNPSDRTLRSAFGTYYSMQDISTLPSDARTLVLLAFANAFPCEQ